MPAVFCMSVTQIIQIHSSKTSCAHLAFEKWELCPCLQSREGLRSSTHGLCQHPTCLWKSTKCIINPWLWEQRIWAVNWTATGRRAMESPWLVLGRRLSGPHLRSVPLRHFRLSLGEKTLSSPMFKKRQSHFITLPWADHQLRARRGATTRSRGGHVWCFNEKPVLGTVVFRRSPEQRELRQVLSAPAGSGHRVLCRQWVLPLPLRV